MIRSRENVSGVTIQKSALALILGNLSADTSHPSQLCNFLLLVFSTFKRKHIECEPSVKVTSALQLGTVRSNEMPTSAIVPTVH